MKIRTRFATCLVILGFSAVLSGCQAEPARGSGDSDPIGGEKRSPSAAALTKREARVDLEDEQLDLRTAYSVDGATKTALQLEALPWRLPASRSLRLELWQALGSFRVRPLDPRGRMIPFESSSGRYQFSTTGSQKRTGTWIELQLRGVDFPSEAPTQIVLDAEAGPEILDLEGRGYLDLSITVIGVGAP